MSDRKSTGQVAQQFSITEPRLSELVRRGKVTPPPPIVSGRRIWDEHHVRQVAVALGIEVPLEFGDRVAEVSV